MSDWKPETGDRKLSLGVVAVVGLGQIGGSIAAGLKKRGLAKRVIGITRRRETARRAQAMGIVDDAGVDLRGVHAADIVVLSTPVRTLLRHITEIGPRLNASALLTDVGSTKSEFIREVRRTKLACSVVAGHPMAGRERAGLDGAGPDLFVDRPWILIPTQVVRPIVLERAAGLAQGLGARPVWMDDGDDHDFAVALVSHVPYLIAYALMGQQPGKGFPKSQGDFLLEVAGNSLRDATRVAASDVGMVLDFLLTNRRNIRRALRVFGGELRRLERALDRETDLRRLLEAARSRREKLN